MIYWITEDDVRTKLPVEYSLLSGNILPAIQQGQQINARDLTGDLLYNAINEKISDGSITGATNSNYKKLLDDYLTPVVLYHTSVYILINSLAKLQNRGLQVENSEFSSGGDLAVYRELKSEFRELADYYTERAKDWLYFNSNLFVEFSYYAGNGEQPASSTNKYNSGGLVLGQAPTFSWNNMSYRGGNCC
jgi:hypothetical protein